MYGLQTQCTQPTIQPTTTRNKTEHCPPSGQQKGTTPKSVTTQGRGTPTWRIFMLYSTPTYRSIASTVIFKSLEVWSLESRWDDHWGRDVISCGCISSIGIQVISERKAWLTSWVSRESMETMLHNEWRQNNKNVKWYAFKEGQKLEWIYALHTKTLENKAVLVGWLAGWLFGWLVDCMAV